MSATNEPTVDKKIEEIPSDDEEAPGLEPVENAELASGGKRQNRNEKKIRKHLAKTGLIAVPGVTKVSVRKSGQTFFSVSEPDVFKSPSGEVYVIFGEPKVDQGTNALAQAASAAGMNPGALGEEAPALVDDEAAPAASGEASGEFAAKDIDLVMAQGKCTREQAVDALRRTNGDIVTAIMELTVTS